MSSPKVVTIKTGKHDLAVKVIDKGLHVFSISFNDKKGDKQEIMIGPEEPKDAVKDRRMLNPLVGRYCNRLPAKELTLTNGTTFTPETESPSDPAAMHGGRGATSAWDQKVFNSISIDQATLFSDQEKAYLSERTGDVAIWEYTSPDGEGGHPGCVRSETAFIVQDGSGPEDIGAVTIVYRAKLLEGEATALNLTHHWSFNLEFSDAGREGPCPVGDVKNHTVHIKSKKVLDLDAETGLPTGRVVPGSHPGKLFDKPIKIGDNFPEKGMIDDYFILERGGGKNQVLNSFKDANVFEDIASDREPVASMSSDKSLLALEFTSNQPGFQCWSGDKDHYDGSDSRRIIHGGKGVENQGDGYKVPPALNFEFHSIYGAWLYPELAKIGWDTVLQKNKIFNGWVRVDIKDRKVVN